MYLIKRQRLNNAHYVYHTFFIFFAALRYDTAIATTNSCAKLTLKNDSFIVAQDPAVECRSIKAIFDLSLCFDQSTPQPATVECHGESAVASIQTRFTRYEVLLKRIVGQRKNSLWDIASNVREISKASNSMAVKKPKVALNRGPASVPGLSEAQQSAAAAQMPTPTNQPTPPGLVIPKIPPNLSISGLFDIYYAQNFNRPPPVIQPSNSSPALPTQQNAFHNFDLYNNQLSLNLAEFTIKNTGKEVSFFVDLDFGQQADYISKFSSGATDSVSKNIGQAVLSYNPEEFSRLTVSAGKMYTNMGYETPKAINNWQYSRSFLFSYGVPYWHVGISAAYVIVPNRFTATAFVYNGWNTIYDTNSGANVALQLVYNVSDAFTLIYNGIEGPEQPNENSDITQIHELIATYNPSAKLQFAWDTLAGWAQRSDANEEVANWWGSSLAARYQLGSIYSLSPRIELFNDPTGFTTGVSQSLTSYTLTQAFKLKDGLEPRIELRYDHATTASFSTSGANKNDQLTFILAAIYSF